MQSRSVKNSADEVSKRREKEKKREQKELERMMKAAAGTGQPASNMPSALVLGAETARYTAPSPAQATVPPERKKGGFFKVANNTGDGSNNQQRHQPPPPPGRSPTQMAPPPPPPPMQGGTWTDTQPPPPPPPTGKRPASPPSQPSTSNRMAAPQFTSSASSSLAATWKGPPTISPNVPSLLAHRTYSTTQPTVPTWKSSSAPSLHPLLADKDDVPSAGISAASGSGSHGRSHQNNKPQDRRNDFNRHESMQNQSPYELPTHASSVNTLRMSKGMSFVPSSSSPRPPVATMTPATGTSVKPASMSLTGGPSPKKKPLDMG